MLTLVHHPNIDSCLKHLTAEENPVPPGGTPGLVFPLRRRGHLLNYIHAEPDADKFKLVRPSSVFFPPIMIRFLNAIATQLEQVAEALVYLHGFQPKPVVHLDVKPVGTSGRSYDVTGLTTTNSKTSSSMTKGTPNSQTSGWRRCSGSPERG